ncbi:MAG: TylF/MycF/NovP-related O-methyltransferase, partial [Ktedonobacteraceae bacterium]
SARLIRDADPRRELHLFDTFEGLPEPDDTDAEFRMGKFEKGQFSCSLQSVRNYVGNEANVHFHRGLFPSSAECVVGEKFSFVHSDVDLYESTRSVLEFFYPRMIPGGVIVSHDYFSCQGPRKAFDEFFSGLPEPLIELPGDQIMAVKLGNHAAGVSVLSSEIP